MDHLAAAEEQIASQRLQQKLQEVNVAAQAHLASIQDHERLNMALMVCQDKYEATKMQKKPGAMNDMVSYIDQSIQDGIKMLPHKLPMEIGRDNLPFSATIL